jgi:hypothetical protein
MTTSFPRLLFDLTIWERVQLNRDINTYGENLQHNRLILSSRGKRDGIQK